LSVASVLTSPCL